MCQKESEFAGTEAGGRGSQDEETVPPAPTLYDSVLISQGFLHRRSTFVNLMLLEPFCSIRTGCLNLLAAGTDLLHGGFDKFCSYPCE